MLIKKKIFEEIQKRELSESHIADKPQVESQLDGNQFDFDSEDHSDESSEENDSLWNEEKVIDNANKRAEEIINVGQEEAKQIIENSKNQIQAELKRLSAEKYVEWEEIENRAIQELDNFGKAKTNLIEESKMVLVEIATELTSKLIKKKVSEDTSILEKLLRETIDEMLLSSEEINKFILKVNSADLSTAEKFAASMRERSGNRIELSVEENSDIMQGSCIVDSTSGSMDLNFSSQLELFKQKMMRSLGEVAKVEESNESFE